MLLGQEQFLQLQDLDVVLPDADGEVVGHELALGRVPGDLLPQDAPLGQLAEDVAARDVDEVGQLAEHGPLRALAAARACRRGGSCGTLRRSRSS